LPARNYLTGNYLIRNYLQKKLLTQNYLQKIGIKLLLKRSEKNEKRQTKRERSCGKGKRGAGHEKGKEDKKRQYTHENI
jgi:hypothetical protein